MLQGLGVETAPMRRATAAHCRPGAPQGKRCVWRDRRRPTRRGRLRSVCKASTSTRTRFGADSALALPRDREHQIFNLGPQPLEIVGLLGASPVPAFLPDGSALTLPWRS